MLKFEAVGYRDALGRYARRSEELQQGLRTMMREESRALLEALRYYAPQKTGAFMRGLGYRTDIKGDSVTATFYASGPHAFLLPIFIYGSKPHPIVAKNAAALRFFWPNGPRGPGIYYFKSVQHPGTDPHPFIAQAMDARTPHFDYNLRTVSRRVLFLS